MAMLMNAVPGFLFAYGETHVTSIMAGLLNATTPMMTGLVIGYAFREQRVDANQAAGIGVGFVGIAFVTGAFTGLAHNSVVGVGALLTATLCYGVAFPYAKRYVATMPYSSTTLPATQVSWSAILLSPLVLLTKTMRAPLTTQALWEGCSRLVQLGPASHTYGTSATSNWPEAPSRARSPISRP